MSMGFGMHSVMADTEKTEHFCCSVFSLFKHDLKCTPVKQGKFNKDINFVVEKTKNGWSIHFLLLYYFFIATSGFRGCFISSTSSFWSGFSTMTVSAHAPSMAFAWMLESFYQLTLITITTTSQPTWSPSMILVNSERQNLIASSRDRPIPFRKRPYCCRPPWRRWWLLRSAVCSCCMHRGKDFLDSWNEQQQSVGKRGMSPNVPTLHSVAGKTWAEATSQKTWAEATSQKTWAEATSQKTWAEATSQKTRAEATSQKTWAEATSQKTQAEATSQKTRAEATSQKTRAEATSQKTRAEATSQKTRAEATSQKTRAEATSQKTWAEATSQKTRAEATSQKTWAEATSQKTWAEATSQKTWAEATSQLALTWGEGGGRGACSSTTAVNPVGLRCSGWMSEDETGCRLTGNFHYFVG